LGRSGLFCTPQPPSQRGAKVAKWLSGKVASGKVIGQV